MGLYQVIELNNGKRRRKREKKGKVEITEIIFEIIKIRPMERFFFSFFVKHVVYNLPSTVGSDTGSQDVEGWGSCVIWLIFCDIC